MHPILFRLPILDVPVHTYGVMIVTGFLLAIFCSWTLAKRQGRFVDECLDFAFWALVGGMAGARFVFILVNRKQYFVDQVWEKVEIPYALAFFNAPSGLLATGVGLVFGAGAFFYAHKTGQKLGSKIFYVLIGIVVGRAAFAWLHSDLSPGMKVTEEWLSILIVWRGGLVFYGAALGGSLAFILFCWLRKMKLGEALNFGDIAIIGLPLAHVFGRFGCIAAGCCWGDPMFHLVDGQAIADIPLAAQFPSEALAYASLLGTSAPEVVEFMRSSGHTVPLFPSQIAESFGESLVFLLLLFVRARKWFHGQVLLTYFIAYPVLRSILEIFRGDAERGYVIEGVLSTSQFISLVVASAALLLILGLRKLRQNELSVGPAAEG